MEMLLYLIFLHQLLPYGDFACVKSAQHNIDTEGHPKEVFVEADEANTFLGRHLLFNRFDFEIFTPGNLERECYEEVCNYEEAREIFENVPNTDKFWKEYTEGKDKRPSRLDVTALLVGLITAGVLVIIVGLLIWYFCHHTCKGGDVSRHSSIRVRHRRSNASLIMRRLDEVSHQTVLPPLSGSDPPGLPSYEQAIAKSGPHDAPPPPYPGSQPGSIRR